MKQVIVGIILGLKFGNDQELSKGYSLLVVVYIFVGAFGWLWGPLGWTVWSEIFPLETRPAGKASRLPSTSSLSSYFGLGFGLWRDILSGGEEIDQIGSLQADFIQQEISDEYFYESAEKISFFFEEKAFDDDGKLKQPKQHSINKAGHDLHDHDPIFKIVSCSDKMSGLLSSLGYKRPIIIQSMYIFKV
ncbi:hypothetical protein L6452_40532 [Arctium lappa]|uniref:Uncharacterized protein n=1 Tax=Arctium lappa TaxID=4217 RepID=A0ACB8XLJ5_ARCLA|nr:hypothetical protein L6452_40532 [Arctium lappa]